MCLCLHSIHLAIFMIYLGAQNLSMLVSASIDLESIFYFLFKVLFLTYEYVSCWLYTSDVLAQKQKAEKGTHSGKAMEESILADYRKDLIDDQGVRKFGSVVR